MVTGIWARIENTTVAEVKNMNPQDRLPPSLVWMTCPNDTLPGMQYRDGIFTVEREAPIDHAAQIASSACECQLLSAVAEGTYTVDMLNHGWPAVQGA